MQLQPVGWARSFSRAGPGVLRRGDPEPSCRGAEGGSRPPGRRTGCTNPSEPLVAEVGRRDEHRETRGSALPGLLGLASPGSEQLL